MRPIRLELEGFTSFRENTVIDFEGADYFALTGPTGSGKSTIIDAICFALYGSVPRYDNKGIVAPAITQGRLEAKVRLDFSVGSERYTAVRVVRRTPKGATTKEARLEHGDEVIAGNADELTAAIGELLGLTFEHFTKCVVLPQGEFARFLHDKAADRQGLLVKLLNLGIYDRMKQESNARAAAAKNRIALADERLTKDLAHATPEALKEASARVESLAKLRIEIDAAAPQFETHAKQAAEARSAGEAARGWIDRIDGLELPDEIGALAKRIEVAHADLAKVKEGLKKARGQEQALAKAFKELPDRAPLDGAVAGHRRHKDFLAKLEPAGRNLARLEEDEAVARKALDEALSAATAAEERVDEIHRADHAIHLAEHLNPGEPCPVCLQPVATLPTHKKPKGLDAAEKALESAQKTSQDCLGAVKEAEKATTTAAATVKAMRDQLADLEKELSGVPALAEAEKAIKVISEAAAALEKGRDSVAAVQEEADDAQALLDELKSEENEARREFEEMRDAFVPLSPPNAERKDLARDWSDLIRWATVQRKEQSKAAVAAEKAETDAANKRDKILAELTRSCIECEIEVEGGKFLEAAVSAHAQARNDAKEIERCIKESKRLREQSKADRAEHDLAHSLALHLSAKAGYFENWIVNEALRRLVVGASSMLKELSEGQYALTIDDRGDFQVTDKHSADESRSARTLSGGETFLASLSLALALADQLAELAAEGSARLEAIFLDEGFDTLDPDALQTVAETVENLAAKGRIVGIVTHVRQLADSVPIQFRVSKDMRTSTVERVVV
ncbi:MAG: repair protein SbcC/Rad50 [Actinomycetota bacterium]|jgi:exonuclease SbcC|nr:repair protein SbcC/Rad50 [Actinomycetota bacterium]